MRKKMDKTCDRRLAWERMGIELKLLTYLAESICCDREYNLLMDKKTWDRLSRIAWNVTLLRGKCEERMALKMKTWSTKTFYPHDDRALIAVTNQIRGWAHQEATQKAENMKKNGEYV